ncbi:MAG: hypothetical protein JRH20_14585 [Deltaproteobacteria bacterium]|nr:hypothetical protein [Deltaproteobacteria bacterium]
MMNRNSDGGCLAQQQHLADWLVEEQMLSVDDLARAHAHQRETGTPLGLALLELKLVQEGKLVDLLARRYKLPKAPARLHRLAVSLKALSFIPQDLCWQYGVFPFGIDTVARRLQVAIADPADEEAKQQLLSLEDIDPELYVVGPKALEKAIRKHYLDALVEDTNHGGRKMRFFGYDNITNPGVAKTVKRKPRPEKESVEGEAKRTPKPEKESVEGEAEWDLGPIKRRPSLEVVIELDAPTEPLAPIKPPPRDTALTPAVAPIAAPRPALARMRGTSLRDEVRRRGEAAAAPSPVPMSPAPMSPAPMSPAPMSPAPMSPASGELLAPKSAKNGHLTERIVALEGAVEQLIALLAKRADKKTSEMLNRIKGTLGS